MKHLKCPREKCWILITTEFYPSKAKVKANGRGYYSLILDDWNPMVCNKCLKVFNFSVNEANNY